MLNINELQKQSQVFDFPAVTSKKGGFRPHFSPLTPLISRELRRKWPKNKIGKAQKKWGLGGEQMKLRRNKRFMRLYDDLLIAVALKLSGIVADSEAKSAVYMTVP
jgi:hypothetical protein